MPSATCSQSPSPEKWFVYHRNQIICAVHSMPQFITETHYVHIVSSKPPFLCLALPLPFDNPFPWLWMMLMGTSPVKQLDSHNVLQDSNTRTRRHATLTTTTMWSTFTCTKGSKNWLDVSCASSAVRVVRIHAVLHFLHLLGSEIAYEHEMAQTKS